MCTVCPDEQREGLRHKGRDPRGKCEGPREEGRGLPVTLKRMVQALLYNDLI